MKQYLVIETKDCWNCWGDKEDKLTCRVCDGEGMIYNKVSLVDVLVELGLLPEKEDD